VERIAFLTDRSPAEALPALPSLGLDVKAEPLADGTIGDLPNLGASLVLVDVEPDPEAAFRLLHAIRPLRLMAPLIAVVGPRDLDRHLWHEVVDDVVDPSAGEAELRLRIALAARRSGMAGEAVVRLGPLSIDPETYQVVVAGRRLDLTYKEFQLLRFLVQHRNRVFTRSQLLQQVWGYDFYGGTRTVDVHVRRLRAKLGSEHEALVQTVRGVGYRAVEPNAADA
jgi:DNA-binding response OmpR family regulator